MPVTSKQPTDPQRAALIAAAERVIKIFPEQPAPLQDLIDAVANLDHVVSRTRGRPRMMHVAETIGELQGQGKTVMQIVEETGISERTVRRYYTKPDK